MALFEHNAENLECLTNHWWCSELYEDGINQESKALSDKLRNWVLGYNVSREDLDEVIWLQDVCLSEWFDQLDYNLQYRFFVGNI
jgi:hypothetical protein